MKIRDEALWLTVRMDLATDGATGKAMEEFVADWCTRAEYALEENAEFAQEDGSFSGMDPAAALREALPAAEVLCGQVSFSALIQALIIVMGVWEHGAAVRDYLSVIERRAVMEMVAMKAAELAERADRVASPQ